MKDWRDEGQVRCRTGSMQDRRDKEQWDAGQEGFSTGEMKDRGDSGQWTGQEACRTLESVSKLTSKNYLKIEINFPILHKNYEKI